MHPSVCVALFLSGLILRTWALAECPSLPLSPARSEVEAFLEDGFDYLVIGGGTAGMVVASRLTENENMRVGVLEAGAFRPNDPVIDVPEHSSLAFGNPDYDWNLATVPQPSAGGRSISLPRGKILGGSSGINGLAWNRASSLEYDSWSIFASNTTGWDWKGLLPSFRKSERFNLSSENPYPGITPADAENAARELQSVQGIRGPTVVSLNTLYADTVSPFVETLNNMGVRTNPDPQSGDNTGVQNTLVAVNRVNGTRTYSAMGYFCNRPAMPNLRILTGAQAERIRFHSDNITSAVATGVEFSVGTRPYIVNVTGEVILSAGSLKTPQILELSGIGSSEILSAYNISTLIDLPSVGENLQEQLFVFAQWQIKQGLETFDELRNNATFATEQSALYNRTGKGWLAALDSTLAFLPLETIVSDDRLAELLQAFDEDTANVSSSSVQALQYPLQRSWLQSSMVPSSELIGNSRGTVDLLANESYFTILGGITHPVSRGTVHVNTSDPLADPVIDPKFLSSTTDALMLADILKFAQDISQVSPLSDIIVGQVTPDPSTMTDEKLLDYVRSICAPGDHLVGTAVMAPRQNGGVVDPTFKVYGTDNVRVVDASVLPFEVTHTQATIYAIAEKAAAMIKRETRHSDTA